MKFFVIFFVLACTGIAGADSAEQTAPKIVPAKSSATIKLIEVPADGIFAIDLTSKAITQLASIPSTSSTANINKFSFVQTGNGFDFAVVPDSEGNLYFFHTIFGERSISSSKVYLKLRKSADSFLNGPAYCPIQNRLTFGDVSSTSVGLKTISSFKFRRMSPSTVKEATHADLIDAVQTDDYQISTDIVCGDLPEGIVFAQKDCHGDKSVNECLADTNSITTIHFKASETHAAIQLSAPKVDSEAPIPLGDNDPFILLTHDQGSHLTFERMYLTPQLINDPNADQQFKQGGISQIVYERLGAELQAAREYKLDFDSLIDPGVYRTIIFPQIEIEPGHQGTMRFTAMLNSAVSPKGGEFAGYLGIILSKFKYSKLPVNSNKITLLPKDSIKLMSYAEFTCQIWDLAGMGAPDGSVYIYGLFAPKFLHSGGRDYIVFSSGRNPFGALKEGVITFPNGSTQPTQDFYKYICGKSPEMSSHAL